MAGTKRASEAVNISEENTKRGLRMDEILVASVLGVVVQQGGSVKILLAYHGQNRARWVEISGKY